MAKRFTDTDKWRKPFIRGLSPQMKLLWFYILDDCDVAGLWPVDWEIMEIRIGCKLDTKEVTEVLKGHIIPVDNGEKWFIPSFIEFQYGPELAKTNNIFKSINKILARYDLYQYLTVPITEEGTTASSYRGRISQKIRDKIYLDADCTCEYCQERKSTTELCVDHFIPLEKGGNNADENLICACLRCNSYKTDLLPADFLSRPHSFLNPTNKIKALVKILQGGFKSPEGGKDKDRDKDKEKVRDEDKNEVKEQGKGHAKKVEEVQTDLADYELWTQSIVDNTDPTWEPMYMNSGLRLQPGRYIGLVEDHLALLARYPKMRPATQQAFRHSLLKHIKENKDKQVQNGTRTNNQQQQSIDRKTAFAKRVIEVNGEQPVQ